MALTREEKLARRRERYATSGHLKNKEYYEQNREAIRQKQTEYYDKTKTQLKNYHLGKGREAVPTEKEREQMRRDKRTNKSKANYRTAKEKVQKKVEQIKQQISPIPDLSILPAYHLYPKPVFKPFEKKEDGFVPSFF